MFDLGVCLTPGGMMLSILWMCSLSAALAQENVSFGLAVTGFSFKFFLQLNQERDGNFVFSPHSIVSAFASLYPATFGASRSEMQTTFKLTGTNVEALRMFNIGDLGSSAQPAMMTTLWFIDRSILSQRVRSQSEVKFIPVGFLHNPERARQMINSFINESTMGKIPQLYPKGTILPGTKLTVASTMHFKAKWKMPFHPQDTEEGPFYGLNGVEVASYMKLEDVQMWHSNIAGLAAQVYSTVITLFSTINIFLCSQAASNQ